MSLSSVARLAAGIGPGTAAPVTGPAPSGHVAVAGTYGDAGLAVADLEARLNALAAAVSDVSATAASLPSGVKLPLISASVTRVPAPASQATTGASGG